LIGDDLIDEYGLMIHPVVLSSGKRLFAETSSPADLKLVDATQAGETVILTFRPARATTP